jgi:uncharacterized protein
VVTPGLLEAALCSGTVMHARHHPVEHRFHYPLFFLRLPMSRIESLGSKLLGINRKAPLRFDFRDHGRRDGSHPLPWVRELLASNGVAAADGEVVVQTLPRVFGYVFNPVSFWFCHDRDGGLRAVVCEVSNTFGECHNYLVVHEDGRCIQSGDVLWAAKVFHVSPFFPVSGRYRFRFGSTRGVHLAAIDYFDNDQRVLTTRLAGRPQPLGDANLARALLRFPLQTVAVMARIHWHALWLWIKRIPFHHKPEPPLEQTTQ